MSVEIEIEDSLDEVDDAGRKAATKFRVDVEELSRELVAKVEDGTYTGDDIEKLSTDLWRMSCDVASDFQCELESIAKDVVWELRRQIEKSIAEDDDDQDDDDQDDATATD